MAGSCPDCGAQMKPLAFSEFCPNDCDRKPCDLPPRGWLCKLKRGHGGPCPTYPDLRPDPSADFSDEETTDPYGSIDWSDLLDPGQFGPVRLCPVCGASNTEPFPTAKSGTWHCLPCGHVW